MKTKQDLIIEKLVEIIMHVGGLSSESFTINETIKQLKSTELCPECHKLASELTALESNRDEKNHPDLKELERRLDNSLAGETEESMNEFLSDQSDKSKRKESWRDFTMTDPIEPEEQAKPDSNKTITFVCEHHFAEPPENGYVYCVRCKKQFKINTSQSSQVEGEREIMDWNKIERDFIIWCRIKWCPTHDQIFEWFKDQFKG
jgi:hypothetical protein